MGKYCDRVASANGIVRWSDKPSDAGLDAEHVKEIPGNDLGVSAFRDAIHHHLYRGARPRRQTLERPGAAHLFVQRIRKDGLIAVVGRAARQVWGFGMKHDEPLRLVYRQRSQQHLVEQRKDRGICGNAKSKRSYGQAEEGRSPAQASKHKKQVGLH